MGALKSNIKVLDDWLIGNRNFFLVEEVPIQTGEPSVVLDVSGTFTLQDMKYHF